MSKQYLPAIPADGGLVGRPVDMRIRPCAFKPELRKAVVLSGSNVLEALRHACHMTGTPIGIVRTAIVHINGRRVPRAMWCTTYLKETDLVSVAVPLRGGGGGGGKNPLRTILSLVVIGVAAVATMWVGGTGIFGASSLLGTGLGLGGTVGAIAGGLVMMGGMLLVNALCPASMPKLSLGNGQQESSQRIWSIDGAQNKADPYGCVPTVLGKIRVAPRFASQSYSVIKDNDQYVRYLYVVSTGDCSVSEPRIGDTDLENYQGWEWVVHRDWTGVEPFTWFQQARAEEALNIEMKHEVGWQVRTTAQNTTHIMCVIVFEGLKHINSQGNGSSVTVEVAVRYRKVGTEEWTNYAQTRTINTTFGFTPSPGSHFIGINASGTIKVDSGEPIAYYNCVQDVHTRESCGETGDAGNISCSYHRTYYYTITFTKYGSNFTGTASFSHATSSSSRNASVTINGTCSVTGLIYSGCTINPLRKCIEWDVDEGQYEVGMQRVTADSDSESTSSTTRDVFTWTLLQSGRNKPAIVADEKHPLTLIELSLKATEQLNGNVDEFNVLACSTAPCWDPIIEEWVTEETSNPAALALRIATGTDIAKPASWDEMDVESFAGFYTWCEAHGWAYNGWITSKANSGETFHNVCSAGRGSYALLNGHGVIWDDPEAPVVDMLTQRNSWGFSSQKALNVEQVQGLRMRFLNEDADYQEDERIVYIDGYDETNATNVIEWEQDGVTDPDLIYKHARLRLAEMQLRPEVYTLSCEAESIALRRGDCIRIVHDVTLWGITSGKITRVLYADNGNITGIQLDEYCPMDAGQSYGVRITNGANTDAYYSVLTQGATESRELTFSTELPATTNIAVDDLVAFGKTQSVGALCKVLSVTPSEGYAAQVTLCDAAPEIYDAIDGAIPDWDSQITWQSRYQMGKPVAPVLLGIVSDDTALRIGPDGTIYPQMYVTYQVPTQPTGVQVYAISVFVREHGAEEQADYYTAMVQGDSVTVLVPNVEEGVTYDVWAQFSTATGLLSPFSATTQHTVVGKTSCPPDITGLVARIVDPQGLELTWDELDEDYLSLKLFSHFEISGAMEGRAVVPSIMFQPYQLTGQLSFSVRAVDITGVKSLTAATVTITVNPPAKGSVTSARLLDEGVVVEWANVRQSWTVERYILTMGTDFSQSYRSLSAKLPASSPFEPNTPVTIQAQDIFDNWGEVSDNTIVTIYPPKTPQIVLGCNPVNGTITIDWQDCRNTTPGAPSIDHYEVSGTLANQNNQSGVVTVQGTHYEAVVPLTAYEYGTQEDEDGTLVNVGTISVSVEAFDKYGISNKDAADYEDNTVQFSIWPPYNPTGMALSSSEEGDAIVLSWKDCKRTFDIAYYLVTDQYTGRQYKVDTNYVVLPSRKEGSYQVTIQAFDVIGHSSAAMPYNMLVGGVGGMTVTARVDGADILVEWSIPDASFSLDYYIIKGDNDIIPDEETISFEDGDQLGTAKVNYFRMPAGAAQTYVFYVWAVDVAGNISTSYASYCTIEIDGPVVPSVGVPLEADGLRLTWEPGTSSGNTLPVVAWDVVRQWEDEEGTHEEDYGRLDVTSVAVPAVTVGDHTFLVRGIDSGGNVGPWGDCDFTAQAPGRVTFMEPTVIDNNVQLYWTQPNFIFFPIREYIFSEIDEDGYEMEIGRVDALFASETESVDGMYTYGITPVDTGGNLGTRTTITCRVAQPPDFVFYDKVDSLFNGDKTNLVLDGNGHMLGPVPTAETWTENAARVIELGGVSATTDTLTHQQKVNAGYETWLEPMESTAVYVETIDHGSLIPSSNIHVTLGYETIRGNPDITCKIEVSQDGSEWVVVSDNAFNVYTTQFRYSRITLTITGGYISINSLLIDLNVKQITDGGRVECKATDNGEGWVSEQETPMLTGTWVAFTRSFVDVQSLPKPNVVNHQDYTAYTVFEDVINPTGFRIFVKDANGNRVTAFVDWFAMGV